MWRSFVGLLHQVIIVSVAAAVVFSTWFLWACIVMAPYMR